MFEWRGDESQSVQIRTFWLLPPETFKLQVGRFQDRLNAVERLTSCGSFEDVADLNLDKRENHDARVRLF